MSHPAIPISTSAHGCNSPLLGNPLPRFEYDRHLHKTLFGETARAVDRLTERKVVIKASDLSKVPQYKLEDPEAELELLLQLDRLGISPKIVHHDRQGTWLYLVLEDGGMDLQSLISNAGRFSESECRDLFKQILELVKGMHDNGYAHLDLKPENILFNPATGLITLCDLGQATDQFVVNGPRGTKAYQPYEQLDKQHNYDPKVSDMYSLGVVLFSMLTQYALVADEHLNWLHRTVQQPARLRQYLTQRFVDKLPDGRRVPILGDDALDLVLGLLAPTNHRLHVDGALAHRWLLSASTVMRD